MRLFKKIAVVCLWLLWGCCQLPTAFAAVRLPGIIGSHMVLQQQKQVKLWGWANPYEKVRVTTSWDHAIYKTEGNRDAYWEIRIQTPAAGGPYVIEVQGDNTLLLEDVLIGEVWLCAGQSNMEMCGNWGLQDIKKELPRAKHPKMRFFYIPKRTAPTAQQQIEGHWEVCDSNSLKSFSAVAYFFGKRLHEQLDRPVGLIEAAWGGTAAEVWTPDSVINGDALLKAVAGRIQPSGMCPYIPGSAYHAMIAPITRFAIKGTIWYQGENNTETALTYRPLFTSMIASWRQAWGYDFPFYYVQIAPFRYKKENSGALLREAQAHAASWPNTGMVVTMDLVTDVQNVHPGNKHDVGYRLANWALGNTYHLNGVVYRNPVMKHADFRGNQARITIANAAHGLMMKGMATDNFEIAGNDRVFHPAEAELKGNSILVWNEAVKHPQAVRYAFHDTSLATVFSKEGLPLVPFRTDDWPLNIAE